MRRVRWSLSGPHRTRSGTPVAVAVKQRGNFAQRSDRDARRHLPAPSDGSPLTHCGVVTACSSTATDGSRCSCRSTTPRSIQLTVKFGIRIVGAGSRGGTGTVNPNRSGRDAPNRTCSASGRLATTVSAYLSSCAGFRAGSSVTRGPCRTCSPARDPGGCRAPRPTGAGPRSGRRTGGRQGPAGGSTAIPSRGRHTPELLEPGVPGLRGRSRVLGTAPRWAWPPRRPATGHVQARLHRPADLDQVGLDRARSVGRDIQGHRTLERPPSDERAGWAEVRLADDFGVAGGDGDRAGVGLQAV